MVQVARCKVHGCGIDLSLNRFTENVNRNQDYENYYLQYTDLYG